MHTKCCPHCPVPLPCWLFLQQWVQCELSDADLMALKLNPTKMHVLNEAPRWMNNKNIWCYLYGNEEMSLLGLHNADVTSKEGIAVVFR